MKVKEFVECLDIFQGIKLIDARTKEPAETPNKGTTFDLFTASKYYGGFYVYKAYTGVDENLIIEITTEEI